MATDVSLLSAGSTSTGTFTFAGGEVTNLREAVVGQVEQNALPISTPEQAFLFDFEGPMKRISLTGALFATAVTRVPSQSVATIEEQKNWWMQIVDGNQQPHTFNSNFNTNTPCMVESVEFNEEGGNPNLLPFNITLLIGS